MQDVEDQLSEVLRRSEARFQRANEIAQLGIAEIDLATSLMTLNPTFQEMCGAPAEIPVLAYENAIHEDDRVRVMGNFETAVATGSAWSDSYRFHRLSDGVMRWFHSSSEVEIKGGEPVVAFGIVRDVTTEREAKTQLELVNGELHHRVKNLFGMMQSMIRLTSREVPGSADFAEALVSRLQTLTAAHAVSMGTDRSTPVVLRDILTSILKPYETRHCRVEVTGSDAVIMQANVTPMGLILHELATNAVKYGALQSNDGILTVDVQAGPLDDRKSRIDVIWREQSADFDRSVLSGVTPNFGTQLIDQLSRQIGAQVHRDWTETGLTFRMTLTAPGTGQRTD